ncbi:MAG: GTP 3',8-cyclase MoaA [Planctomycetota bacterium]
MVVDRFGRRLGKLRISLTDRCNMKCLYCMPENPVWKKRGEILTLEEIFNIAKIFVSSFNVKEIRLTGGEPLLRSGITILVEWLNSLKSSGLKRLSLTTNGLLLKHYIYDLKEAGLDDLNVSVDSLEPLTFYRITKGGQIKDVMDGIQEAKKTGLRIKINTVLIKGINDSEIENLLEWAINEKSEIRFIEFMPVYGVNWWSKEKVVSYNEILETISKRHKIQIIENSREEPAKKFLIDDKFQCGIIATITNPFCKFCNRIRLTADGKIVSCLFANSGYDIRKFIKAGEIENIEKTIKIAWENKPEGFIALKGRIYNTVPMYALGG